MAQLSGIMFLAGDQYDVDVFDDIVRRSSTSSNSWYETARTIRRYPTIAMGRAILAAPIIGRRAVISGESSRARRVLEKVLLPVYKSYLRNTTYACIDYGWLAHEVQPYKNKLDGVYQVRMKPLRHEYTDLTADAQGFVNGAVNYVPNPRTVSAKLDRVKVRGSNFCHAAAADEYANPYGYAMLKNVEDTYNAYFEVEESAKRYNKKIAGSHWKLTFPIGYTPVDDGNGNQQMKSNQLIANELLASLRSSGMVAIPVNPDSIKGMLEGEVGASSSPAWSLELLSESGSQDIFLDRERFLDALMMRGLILPERIALEGQFGTKAEASEHADIALNAIEQYGDNIFEWVNGPTGVCASILAINGIDWYPGIAYLDAMPLSDDAKQFMREIMRALVNGTTDLFRTIDLVELGRKTDVPMLKEQIALMVEEAEGLKKAQVDSAKKMAAQSIDTGAPNAG